MGRDDWFLFAGLGGASIALLLVVAHALFPSINPEWVAAVAAIVQAIGVFIAVRMSGTISRDQFRDQEAEKIRRNIVSMDAVIGRALQAIDTVKDSLTLEAAGMEVPDVVPMLTTIVEALTPMRIHELPDPVLVRLAIEIKSSIIELVEWIQDNSVALEMKRQIKMQVPLKVVAKVERAKNVCTYFITYVRKQRYL